MDSERMKEHERKNAAEMARLHARVHETVRLRQESAKKRVEWEQACSDFHTRYNSLAFPGGYAGALERIPAGDPNTMEAAICFLECRPYFFRSGHMFKGILRRCRRAPLSPNQAARLKILERRPLGVARRKSGQEKASLVPNWGNLDSGLDALDQSLTPFLG